MKIRFTLFNTEGGNGDGNGGGGTILSGGSQGSQGGGASQDPANGDEGAPSAYDFRTALDEKGGFKQGWTDGLPADFKEFAGSLNKYPNLTEAMRALGHSQKALGQRTQLKPPAPDAKAEEIAAWRKTLGVPDKPEDYGIKQPEKLPEGVIWDEAVANGFAKLSHEIGLTPAQAQKLMEFDLGQKEQMAKSGQSQVTQYVDSQRKELEGLWGDKLTDNTARALKTAQLLGLDPNDAEIGNSAKMIKALHAASLLMQEDKLLGSGKEGSGMTALQQAEDIRRNPNNPWHKAYLGQEGKERQTEAANMLRRLSGVPDTAVKTL